MLLEGKTSEPYWIHGVARIKLSLPWPLPDPKVKLELTWEEKAEPAPVTPFLRGAAMNHHKLSESSWTLADAKTLGIDPDDATPSALAGDERIPMVPVDARAGALLCSAPDWPLGHAYRRCPQRTAAH